MDCTKITYDRSIGVAGCEPLIVCAKFPVPEPVCLDVVFDRPGAPFAGVPNAQDAPDPLEVTRRYKLRTQQAQEKQVIPQTYFGILYSSRAQRRVAILWY